MKTLLVLWSLIALSWSAPADTSLQKLPALRHEEVRDQFGQYALRYITAENTVVSERGRLVPNLYGDYVLEMEGEYQFVGDDGKLYVTRYRAGHDGFHVDTEYLPEPIPVIPVAKK